MYTRERERQRAIRSSQRMQKAGNFFRPLFLTSAREGNELWAQTGSENVSLFAMSMKRLSHCTGLSRSTFDDYFNISADWHFRNWLKFFSLCVVIKCTTLRCSNTRKDKALKNFMYDILAKILTYLFVFVHKFTICYSL